MTDTCIYHIIIDKFAYQYELSLIILIKINKDLEIGLHSIVLFLSLAMNLRVKDSTELLFYLIEVI